MLLGTPAYMSPEQAEGEQIDTAADVYALGMILYEILCGRLPLDKEEYDQLAPTKLIRLMREQEPLKPSARLAGLGAKAEAVAEKRVTKPEPLRKKLKGDLDSIVMKAIQSDRAHRYPSVMALATDIRNYLENKPVQARKNSRVYLFRMFVRRHPRGFSLSAAILTVLIAVGAFFQYQRVQQDLLNAAYDNLQGILASYDSREESYTNDPIKILKNITTTLDGIGTKDVKTAKLRLQLGYCFNIHDEHELSKPQFQKAYDIYSRENNYEQEAIKARLGILTADVRSGPEQLSQEDFDRVFNEIGGLDSSEGKKRFTMTASRIKADWFKEQGNYLEAQEIYQIIYDSLQTIEEKLDEDALIAMNNMGHNLMLLGSWKEASAVMKETYELRKQFYASMNAYTWSSMHNLALIYDQLKMKEEAAVYAQQAFDLAPGLFIPGHKEIFDSTVTLSLVRLAQENAQESQRLLESVYPDVIEALGKDHSTTWMIQNNLASIYNTLNKSKEALIIKQEELRFRDKHKPDWRESDAKGLYFLLTLGEIYRNLGEHKKTLELSYLPAYIGLSKIESKNPKDHETASIYLREALKEISAEDRVPLVKQHLEQIQAWEQETGRELTEAKALLEAYAK
jgi:non-specific serine/threonine protein kinase/serine/threonine-protein kinase